MGNLLEGKNKVTYSVLILNYNCSNFTKKAVDSVLRHCTDGNFIIQIVDNNSSEGDRQELKSIQNPKVSSLELPENRGFAFGYNAAAHESFSKCDPEYFVIMNPDIEIIQDGTIEALINRAQNGGESIVGAQPLIQNYRFSGEDVTQACLRRVPDYWDLVICESIFLRYIFKSRFRNFIMADCMPYDRVISFFVPSGAFFVIKAEEWFALKGFDENTFLYAEELILGKKLQEKSKMLLFDPSIKVMHYQGATTGFEKWAPLRKMYRHRKRSEHYYIRQYLGVGIIKGYIFQTIMEIGYILRVMAWLIYKVIHANKMTSKIF